MSQPNVEIFMYRGVFGGVDYEYTKNFYFYHFLLLLPFFSTITFPTFTTFPTFPTFTTFYPLSLLPLIYQFLLTITFTTHFLNLFFADSLLFLIAGTFLAIFQNSLTSLRRVIRSDPGRRPKKAKPLFAELFSSQALKYQWWQHWWELFSFCIFFHTMYELWIAKKLRTARFLCTESNKSRFLLFCCGFDHIYA